VPDRLQVESHGRPYEDCVGSAQADAVIVRIMYIMTNI
jgi:hypothetical protein